MKALNLFPVFFLSVCTLVAQETEDTRYTANAGVTFTDGNSNTEQFNVGFDARKVTEKTEITATAFYSYGRNSNEVDGETVDVTSLDKGRIDIKANYLFSEKNYAYASLTLERDELSSIDRRIAGGPGLGHYFRRDDVLTFAVEAGGVWVFEEIDQISDDYAAVRLAQNLNWAIREGARIRQEVEIITELSDEENYFINAKLIAEAALTATLGLRLEMRDTYNNQPGIDKERNDLTLLSGVTVSW